MNNFKKVLSLLLVAFFALILVGCGGNDAEKAAQQEIEENLEQLYVTGLEDALNDLALPKYFKGDKKKTITWESDSDSLVITEYDDGDDNKNMFFKGKIVLKKEGHNFKLTATLKYEYEEGKFVSGTKEFKGNVVADEWADNNYETIAAAKSTEGKTSNESKIKFQGTVTFTTDAGYIVSDKTGSIYVYGSSHGRKVGEKVTVRGVWASYNNMPQVATGSNAQVIGQDTTTTYESLAEEKTIAEIAAIKTQKVDAANTTRIFKTIVSAQTIANSTYNTYKFVDPTDSSKYVEVSKYNSTTTLTEIGGLVESKKVYTLYVILYCSRTAETDGIWDVLYVPGSAVETTIELTDEQKANNALAAVVAGINSEYFDNAEVTLVASDAAGVAFSYSVTEGSTALEIKDGKLEVKCQSEEVIGKIKIIATLNNITVEKEVTIKVGVALKHWLSVTEALEICNNLEDGKTSTERYFVYAQVKSIDNETYCNLTVTDGTSNMIVYGLYTEDGAKKYGKKDDAAFTGTIPVKVGDVIFLNTKIQKYIKNGAVTPELVYSWLQPTQHDGLQVMTPMNVSDAYALAETLDGPSKETTTQEYYVYAQVKSIDNETYCNLTVTDGSKDIIVYGLYTEDGAKKYGTKEDASFTGTIPVKVGGTVLVKTKIQNYNGKYELVNAKLLKVEEPKVQKNPQLTNPEANKEYTVAEILKVMEEYDSGTTSTDLFIVKGKAISSTYDSEHNSYTIILEGLDGTTFKLYSAQLDSSITEDFKAQDAFKDMTVVCKGYLKLFGTEYEMPYLGTSPNGSAYSPVISSVTK